MKRHKALRSCFLRARSLVQIAQLNNASDNSKLWSKTAITGSKVAGKSIMEHVSSERIRWKQALDKERPLLQPVAHDALTAKVLEQAGFTAIQVGGFGVAGARHGLPDIDVPISASVTKPSKTSW